MAIISVFVSHSHKDNAFCQAIVKALKDAGADVWYDEQSLSTGQLMPVVQREIGRRPVFIVILSKSAFASQWVLREATWAYEMADRDPTRIIIPITASPIARTDFDPTAGWLFMSGFKRIEAPNYEPLPVKEAVRSVLHALALTPTGAAPEPTAPQPAESIDDLMERGKALFTQKRYHEALPLFQRATVIAAGNADAWGYLGRTLQRLARYDEAIQSLDRALQINPHLTWIWSSKAGALGYLGRYAEQLETCDRVLSLDPKHAFAWANKGTALNNLGHFPEALSAYDRAIVLDPDVAGFWYNKGRTLVNLQRIDEALGAFDNAIALDQYDPNTWDNKGSTLLMLKKYTEALVAYDRALTLDPNLTSAWSGKARTLRTLGREAEAQDATRHAKELGG